MKKLNKKHQKVSPLSGPSFIDNGDGTISDVSTGLQWIKQPELIIPEAMNWSIAKAKCEKLKYAGHSDWRLPSIKELISIVDYGRHDPAVDTTFFPSIQSKRYWSGSSYAPHSVYAWRVSFVVGDVYFGNKDNTYGVLPVRSSQ